MVLDPEIVNGDEKGARETVDVFVDWATPLIYGVTETEDGKTVPEFGCNVLVVDVVLTTDHPGWFQLYVTVAPLGIFDGVTSNVLELVVPHGRFTPPGDSAKVGISVFVME